MPTDRDPLDPELDPLAEPVRRAAERILASHYVIALSGAGISAESGIPTFRGKDGLWTKHGEPPMNQYEQFRRDPGAYWSQQRARRDQPDELMRTLRAAVPNDGHFAMAELETMGVLRHTITQNVDGLHRVAGSQEITEIHGNTAWVRCVHCGHRLPSEDVDDEAPVPLCVECGGPLKTDAVMFGEPIPQPALASCAMASRQADCCLLVGTTAVVMPAAGFAWDIYQSGGSLIEINPEPTEISPACEITVRAPSGEAMPRIVAMIKQLRQERDAE